MADLTPNFNLEKATENEYYDVALHGRNMDKIDAALKANEGAVDDLAGEDRTTETVKGNADAINAHLAESMPHRTTDGDIAYKYGIACQNGVWGILVEEVV